MGRLPAQSVGRFTVVKEDGIFELRAQSGNNISRVLYFFFVGNKIILTHGFIKKTQKTPREEIDKAKAYRKDFYKQEGK